MKALAIKALSFSVKKGIKPFIVIGITFNILATIFFFVVSLNKAGIVEVITIMYEFALGMAIWFLSTAIIVGITIDQWSSAKKFILACRRLAETEKAFTPAKILAMAEKIRSQNEESQKYQNWVREKKFQQSRCQPI